MNSKIYYGTIAWNGYKDARDGSFTTVAEDMHSLIDGIKLSLKEYKKRGAYFECAAVESPILNSTPDENNYTIADITNEVLLQLFNKPNTRRKNGKKSI